MFKRALTGFQRITRSEKSRYAAWIARNTVEMQDIRKRLKALRRQPTFAFLIWCRPGRLNQATHTINNLVHQLYPAWEIFVLTTEESEQEISHEKNIHYLHPDRVADAVSHTRGEYLVMLTAGDTIAPHALVSLAEAIDTNSRPDLVYSDEDMLNQDGKLTRPVFKPDWSPDLLLTQYYLGNLTAFRREAVNKCGGIDWSLGEVASHDLALRMAEKRCRIVHIPDVLFHKHADSDPTFDSTSIRKVLDRAIRRRKLPATVTEDEKYPGLFIPHWSAAGKPPVSIIILNKDMPDYLADCLESIFMQTSYPQYDVLLIDNDSTSRRTHDLYRKWQAVEPQRFRVIGNNDAFNFSRFNNQAAREVKGEFLLFLNNDTRLLSPEWLEEMVGQAARPEIGVVGCLLQFPNRTVQHAGIILSRPFIALHTHYRSPAGSRGHLGRLRVPAECSMVTGACMMIRKGLFQELGGFDENLEVAYNDADLCLRARKAGYRNLVLPQVRLVHRESITRGRDSSGKARSRFEMEKEYFISRWGPIGVDPYYNPNFDQSRGDYSLPV